MSEEWSHFLCKKNVAGSCFISWLKSCSIWSAENPKRLQVMLGRLFLKVQFGFLVKGLMIYGSPKTISTLLDQVSFHSSQPSRNICGLWPEGNDSEFMSRKLGG